MSLLDVLPEPARLDEGSVAYLALMRVRRFGVRRELGPLSEGELLLAHAANKLLGLNNVTLIDKNNNIKLTYVFI